MCATCRRRQLTLWQCACPEVPRVEGASVAAHLCGVHSTPGESLNIPPSGHVFPTQSSDTVCPDGKDRWNQ